MTLAPRLANASAWDLPMPLPAPVMGSSRTSSNQAVPFDRPHPPSRQLIVISFRLPELKDVCTVAQSAVPLTALVATRGEPCNSCTLSSAPMPVFFRRSRVRTRSTTSYLQPLLGPGLASTSGPIPDASGSP